MTHPPAGPSTPTPPSGPAKEDSPLDPRSPKGREVAERLTRRLALIELEIAQRADAARGRAA
jgi:hypothetical protein